MKTLLFILLFTISAFSQTPQDIYDDLSELPTINERKAVYKQQTPEVKRELWRIHLRLARNIEGLTQAQRNAIDQIIAANTDEQMKEASANVAELFSFELGRKIFYTLGSFGGAAMEMPEGDCNCTTKSYNWSCTGDCGGGSGCSVVAASCGIMWLWDCNGSCTTGSSARCGTKPLKTTTN